jgi:hypothetical protein
MKGHQCLQSMCMVWVFSTDSVFCAKHRVGLTQATGAGSFN